jgi:ubiquinone/menaquinone biosynthesis C-methylase UbiE
MLLLKEAELSVAELQEILSLPQSNISTQLSKLKAGKLLVDRRSGKNRLYALSEEAQILWKKHHLDSLLSGLVEELGFLKRDEQMLKFVLEKRTQTARGYFDALAGKFGRDYVPGRSWQGVAEMMLKLLPAWKIADLGAGEGTLSLMMAQRAEQVVAVDNSEKMVEYGKQVIAEQQIKNVEFRLGELEDPPIESGTMDLVIFSQSLHHAISPNRAIAAAARILKPGGVILILDLLCHHFEEARELYADQWLGFEESELLLMLTEHLFTEVSIQTVHRESVAPFFQSILAYGRKV